MLQWQKWYTTPLGLNCLKASTDFLSHISCQLNNFNISLNFGVLSQAGSFLNIKNIFNIYDPLLPNQQKNLNDPPNIALCANSNQLPFKDNSIDCILAIHYLEQLSKIRLQQYLNEVNRILNNNGKFVIISFNPHGLWSYYHKYIDNNFLPINNKSFNCISYNKLQNQLKLNFSLLEARFCVYDLPKQNLSDYLHNICNKIGDRWLPHLSNLYLMVLTKKTIEMHAILDTSKQLYYPLMNNPALVNKNISNINNIIHED